MSRISKWWQMVWTSLMYVFGPTDEELWEQLLEDADREHRRGNTRSFAVALVSEAYEEWVHKRIIEMLFVPDIPKPAWLKFEHVLNHDTPDEVARFAVQTFDDLQIRLNGALENENARKFRSFLEQRAEGARMRAA